MTTLPQSEWLTATEAANYLRIKPRTILIWARQGHVKGYVLSGTERVTWRFLRSDLDAGYKSRFRYSDAQYFNLSENDRRIAQARREQKFPTLEQVKHAINSMPARTEIERRNRAVIAFALLTGARDSAIASAKLKHVDLSTNSFNQDAREVRTKFRKSFTTFFFPVGDEIRQIVAEWVSSLREIELWGNDDPLFPATLVLVGATRHFEASGLQHRHWSNASPIRLIFREAFANVGLPYFNPHSLRNTLVQLGERLCTSPEQFKAWSQNLGHEKALTTFLSYGEVASQRQGEIIRELAAPQKPVQSDFREIAEELLRTVRASLVATKDQQTWLPK